MLSRLEGECKNLSEKQEIEAFLIHFYYFTPQENKISRNILNCYEL